MKNTTGIKNSFEEYFRELIGDDEAEQFFCAIREKETRRALRVNTLKVSREKLKKWLEEQGYEVRESEFSSDGLEIEGRGKRLALKLPYHAGFTYPQDQSSMFAVEVLDPQPGETVIDLTAAPGGKTTHIAQRMKNTGVLIGNDMDSRRLKALHSNLERLGIWNVLVTRATPHKLSRIYPETFDRVLLDPSCSGEGLLVTHDGKPDFWNKKGLKRYSAEQFGLLCSAFTLLKPGGRLVYSTCTLNDVEDDGVVERLLAKFPEAEILCVGAEAEPEQLVRADGSELKGVRFWPQKTGTKGFFCIAIGKKAALEVEREHVPQDKLKALSKRQLERFSSYVRKTFGCDLPDAEFILKDQTLFMVSKEISKFPLRFRPSLSFPFLEIHRDEMRLSHAGALWIGLHAKKSVKELSREEAGRLFEEEMVDEGLVRFDEFPLGFGKLPKQF